MADENFTNDPYVILARKYRPQTFDDLLGQDALVQTLTNAINNNRIHHAYILTGIRGVGKTSTARIIAKALNCTGVDGKGGPTVHPCGVCENCKAITAGRHIDVMELDAASRTGVDDIREILDGVRYKPTNARYKIYIIDEVHMLSKNAFNALLKTLEEPPSHVKFIFATTEIRKVPVTILSRCQRFDLQRLKIDELMKMYHKIIQCENLSADEDALQLLARAADGSARDATSLLDQAISLGSGNIKLDIVKNMIGLKEEKGSGTNRTRVVNIREEDYDVYIGRAGRGMDGYFGNPFRLGAGMPRGATLEKYREYFYRRIHADPEFKRRVEALQGKTLGCFCKPHPCHGDIIKEYLDSLSNK